MGIRATVAINLRRLRAERRITQEELAHLAGLDRTYISYIENQRYGVSVDVLERLAKGLKVDPIEFLQSRKRAKTS